LFLRAACISIVAVALIAIGTGAAYAGGWDLIGSNSGQGAVTLRAWTRNYNTVAFVADHPGTAVRAIVSVKCRNGDTFTEGWLTGTTLSASSSTGSLTTEDATTVFELLRITPGRYSS
jgi:hypothetical protein